MDFPVSLSAVFIRYFYRENPSCQYKYRRGFWVDAQRRRCLICEIARNPEDGLPGAAAGLSRSGAECRLDQAAGLMTIKKDKK